MKKTRVLSSFALLLTATIWGVAFVAQSIGMDYVSPFTFNAVRCAIGGFSLLPVILFMRRGSRMRKEPFLNRELLVGGLLCGLFLFIGSSLQQIGIQYTSVGKAGFITACYIVFIPIMGLLLKKRPPLMTWVAVALAMAGLYLLCMAGEFSINNGDVYVLISSVGFALHVMVIDHFSPKVDGVKLACLQFFVCSALSAVFMGLLETPEAPRIAQAWLPILYAGVMSCGVAYTLQIIGQKYISPAPASLILSLESCVAVLAGWVLLGQRLTAREVTGCIVMFMAIVLAQLPEKTSRQRAPICVTEEGTELD